MQATFLVLVAAVLALGLLWFLRTSPSKLAYQLYTFAIFALSILAVLSLVRGALGLALMFATLAIGLFLRSKWSFVSGLPRDKMNEHKLGEKPGKTSQIQTTHLKMEIDLASGAIRGRVLKGVFAGRDVTTMAPAELALLWQDCRFEDPQSAQVIETYLDHIHSSWREDMARAEAEVGPGGKMTAEEAYDILGLEPGASEHDVRQAHRELMKKLHPDRGGSSYLAAKINEAKELLLKS